jgi:hypothetical protein
MAHMNVGHPWAVQTPAHGHAVIFCCGMRTVKKHQAISHENWDYPNRGSLKYFMTINCTHTTTCRVHICFQIFTLYGLHFANGYNINTLRISWFYITFREHIGERVCSTTTAVTYVCVQYNPYVICKHGYEASFSVSGWTGIIEDILMGPMCYLTG